MVIAVMNDFNKVRLDTIKQGECFLRDNNYYVKLDKANDYINSAFHVANLDRGTYEIMSCVVMVEPVESRLEIKRTGRCKEFYK